MTIPTRDCIRCDFCASVCPDQLQPQQLYAFSRYQQHDQARQFDILQCSECGACEAVCPSHLPLLDIFRNEKLALRDQEHTDAEAVHWQQRFERHQARSYQETIAQQERKLRKLQAKTKDLADGKDISRPAQESDANATSVAAKTPAQIQAEIAAAVARTRARKAALQQNNPANDSARQPEPGFKENTSREKGSQESDS